MVDIYFIRHTSVGVSKAVCYGFSDVPLSENFAFEKQEVWSKLQKAATFQSHQQVHIYTSPLQRCALLADYVQQQLSPKIIVQHDNRVKEMNFGDWEMKKWEELPIDSFQAWMTAFVHTAVPNGENLEKVHQRTEHFLTEIIEKHHKPDNLTPETVLIFAHAGSIRTMLVQCLGMPIEHTFRFGMEYGAVSRARYIQGHWKVDFVNR